MSTLARRRISDTVGSGTPAASSIAAADCRGERSPTFVGHSGLSPGTRSPAA